MKWSFLDYSGEIIQTVANDRSSDDFIGKMKYMAQRHGYTGQRQPSDDLPAKQVGDKDVWVPLLTSLTGCRISSNFCKDVPKVYTSPKFIAS